MQLKEPYKQVMFHPSFRLNNKRYSIEELEAYAHHLVRCGEQHEIEAGDFLLDWIDNQDYITVQTSGSTGIPKKIKVLKQHMINSAVATGVFFKLKPESTALLCLSPKYIAGKMMLVRAMVLGLRLDFVSPKSNPLDELYKQYDFCAMVPLQLDNSINRLHLLKKLIVGGGQISEHLIALVQGIPTKIYETYGMTETVTHIAAKRVNPKKKAKETSLFKAFPQVALSVDHRNCLVIKAPLVSNTTIVTNDIVELHTYKKFQWKGRIDNVINSGGVKLSPEVIERKLQLIIRERFFVSGLPDDKLGERLILIIENSSGLIDTKTFFQKIELLNTLSKYEIPKEIYFLETFLETPTGKIHRGNNLLQVTQNL